MSDKSLTIKELLANIDARISHIEDIEADNRDIIIKLVKQGNQIVKFLSNIEIEDITDEFENISSPPPSQSENLRSNKMKELKELVEEFMDKHKDLEELEEELKKHKDDIVPGKIGEA